MEQGGGSPWGEGGNDSLDAECEGTVPTLIRKLMYEVRVLAPIWPTAPCLSPCVLCSSSPQTQRGGLGTCGLVFIGLSPWALAQFHDWISIERDGVGFQVPESLRRIKLHLVKAPGLKAQGNKGTLLSQNLPVLSVP